ncbi:PREDICTED: uncharacterized protein LOC106113491 [Papilio xuthus]|uniref:Uncharacterized protein LOC106113491 n=2 Tax=Papilio xuthus TaxID=66420 RepID=A0AAJ7E3Y5_PAPXU|nr:PREDICTED: uncharacterized protein LOC106113491 [Papilio xuthus]
MYCLRAYRLGALTCSALNAAVMPPPASNMAVARFRPPSPCDVTPDKKPCFDMTNVRVERANQCHSNMIRLFLYTHCWPREPSVVGLWMSSDSPYLDILTDKYSNSGDRFLAFEQLDRTRESRLIGVCVANKLFPWMVAELEEWANFTYCKPDRTRMYFIAHCIKNADLIRKYNLEYIYDVEVLCTDASVAARGVGKRLLDVTLAHADDLGYPLAQVIAVSHYAAKICEKCGMKREWSMDYDDYVDRTGHQVFFPRRPHLSVAVYSKFFDPTKPKPLPCKPPYL